MRFSLQRTRLVSVSKRACACADGCGGGWKAPQISYAGELKACAGCKMDEEEEVSRQYSWDCSKQR